VFSFIPIIVIIEISVFDDMRLSDLRDGESGIITKVLGRGAFRRRIVEMGFVRGKKVTVVKNAPLKDPIEYNLIGYHISLRRSEASLIDVTTKKDRFNSSHGKYDGVITEELLKTSAKEKGKIINVALVGNPNAGKTTIFNFASRSRERVANYGGVTVTSKSATFEQGGYTFLITDLPGTYSLSAYSPEEIFVRDFIVQNTPDVVINVVDASNLERNLYLTTQLIDLDVKVIVALNMYDDLLKNNDEFDYVSLGRMTGIPFVPTIGYKGVGIGKLFEKVINVYNDDDPIVRHIHINYGIEIQESIRSIQEKIKIEPNYHLTDKISSRFIAIKLLEKDRHVYHILKSAMNYEEITDAAIHEINRLEGEYHNDSETIIADAKYGFIAGALKETLSTDLSSKGLKTRAIDNVLTNRYFGFPFFILFIYLMFTATFRVGQYPVDWINQGVEMLGGLIDNTLPSGSLKDMLVDGIIGGVGGVIVFLPNIIILFFFISIMEDTGYMARAAFIMDKLMHRIGLHGKSFIPLIMGFGCNVPAIMATRTIENKNNRLLTMLIAPFMSCSARLPVYILLIGAFFPDYRGSILFLIYMLGIVFAVISAFILKRIFFHTEETPFVMELPPYRIPTIRSIIRHMWNKASLYLRKMGGVILVASIVIWALEYFPRKVSYSADYDARISLLSNELGRSSHNSASESDQQVIHDLQNQIREMTLMKKTEHQEKSYIGRIGKLIEPLMKPLGFDWKIGICLLTGIAAKEVVVSTMGVLYHVGENKGKSIEKLSEKLINASYTEGKQKGNKVYSPLVAFSLLLFILIYFPCIAVIAAIYRESGSFGWALFTIIYSTSVAWMVSFIVFQVGSLFT
jgi:ferrous iron transport protein B